MALGPLTTPTCDRDADSSMYVRGRNGVFVADMADAAQRQAFADLLTDLAGGPEEIAARDAYNARKLQDERDCTARFHAYAGGRLCSQNDRAFRDAELRREIAELDAAFGRPAPLDTFTRLSTRPARQVGDNNANVEAA